jgi:hypothetical protein
MLKILLTYFANSRTVRLRRYLENHTLTPPVIERDRRLTGNMYGQTDAPIAPKGFELNSAWRVRNFQSGSSELLLTAPAAREAYDVNKLLFVHESIHIDIFASPIADGKTVSFLLLKSIHDARAQRLIRCDPIAYGRKYPAIFHNYE